MPKEDAPKEIRNITTKIIQDNVEVLHIAQNFFRKDDDLMLMKYASQDLKITSDNKMLFVIENALEETFIRNKREAILKHMKENSGRIFELSFEVKVTQQNTVIKRLDTNAAKMQHLVDKNDMLANFIKTLGLEPE